MEIHQLKYFVAVASCGSFSKAAERCGVSQPSLSDAISRLEGEFNEKLFLRLPHKAATTPLGRMLLERAIRILKEIEMCSADARDLRSSQGGELTIGVIPTVGPYLLPKAIMQFARERPKLHINLIEEISGSLLGRLGEGEIDLAIMSQPVPAGRFVIEPLFIEDLELVVACTHPFGRKSSVESRDLRGASFIMMEEKHCLARQVSDYIVRQRMNIHICSKASQIETIIAMIALGLGISILPKMVKLGMRPGVKFLPFEKAKPVRTIVAVWRKQSKPAHAAIEFLERLKKPQ